MGHNKHWSFPLCYNQVSTKTCSNILLSPQVPFLAYFNLQPAQHTGLEPYTSPRKKNVSAPPAKLPGPIYPRYDSIALASPLGRLVDYYLQYVYLLCFLSHSGSQHNSSRPEIKSVMVCLGQVNKGKVKVKLSCVWPQCSSLSQPLSFWCPRICCPRTQESQLLCVTCKIV